MNPEPDQAPLRRILLIGMGRGGVDARMFQGFNQYRRGARTWILNDLGHNNEKLPELLARKHPFLNVDGAFGHFFDAGLVEQLQKAKIPVVDVSGSETARELPGIRVNGGGIGRMAADHFQGRHYESYLYVSNEARRFEVDRWLGFEAGVGEKGKKAVWALCETGKINDSLRERFSGIAESPLEQLLMNLPKPLAVMCATDYTGLQVCELARGRGLRVPDDLSVLGVDDFEVLCESCFPPLSSISFPAEKMGFEAARLLDQMMRGEEPEIPQPFEPTLVHTRASTELSAVGDSAVARAVLYMREHIRENLRTSDIAYHVHMHERTLLRHFQKAIGRTPTEELQRIRLESARELLLDSDSPMYEISDACGFSSPDMFTRHFKADAGFSPSEFRELHRL